MSADFTEEDLARWEKSRRRQGCLIGFRWLVAAWLTWEAASRHGAGEGAVLPILAGALGWFLLGLCTSERNPPPDPRERVG